MAGLLRVSDDTIYGQAERDSALIERKKSEPILNLDDVRIFEFGLWVNDVSGADAYCFNARKQKNRGCIFSETTPLGTKYSIRFQLLWIVYAKPYVC